MVGSVEELTPEAFAIFNQFS